MLRIVRPRPIAASAPNRVRSRPGRLGTTLAATQQILPGCGRGEGRRGAWPNPALSEGSDRRHGPSRTENPPNGSSRAAPPCRSRLRPTCLTLYRGGEAGQAIQMPEVAHSLGFALCLGEATAWPRGGLIVPLTRLCCERFWLLGIRLDSGHTQTPPYRRAEIQVSGPSSTQRSSRRHSEMKPPPPPQTL